jgi:hypothetical protein
MMNEIKSEEINDDTHLSYQNSKYQGKGDDKIKTRERENMIIDITLDTEINTYRNAKTCRTKEISVSEAFCIHQLHFQYSISHLFVSLSGFRARIQYDSFKGFRLSLVLTAFTSWTNI